MQVKSLLLLVAAVSALPGPAANPEPFDIQVKITQANSETSPNGLFPMDAGEGGKSGRMP